MGVHSHTIFAPNWDVDTFNMWGQIQNEVDPDVLEYLILIC